ncbi:MAG TPA: prepilin-type N-terminal cleavage/methylation domain-containing protein [Longimicrobiales bacterium]|nr:prepilin-type N-terminal cleavage/methylation domain-containing protein [Longimicrobiales bacterium]
MRTGRHGFTLVELLIVVVLVGLIVRLAIPSYQRYVLTARAAAAISEIETVRLAAYTYHSDALEWPADVDRGIVPPELVPYLGDGFSFTGDHYMLDWDNWTLPDGSPSEPETGVLVGISMTTADKRLGSAFVRLLGDGAARATIDEHYTLVVVAAD